MWLSGRREADLPTLCTTVRKKGLKALLGGRWVKENNPAGSGFPPSRMATTLSLLAFTDERDLAGSLTSSEGREREANEVLFRSGEGERV